MKNAFKDEIEKLYSIVLSTEDSICKINKIKSCKDFLGISQESTFSDYYNDICRQEHIKGVVYTPKEIVTYMLENSISPKDIINNPFIKILDPSCGAGNIIIELLEYLEGIYVKNLDKININSGLNLKKEDIKKHIISNNIFGLDVDELSIKILLIELYLNSQVINEDNFKCTDFLMNKSLFQQKKFDIILGNPPYIGRKSIDRNYSDLIKKEYREIYGDKSDLSYCFFKKALQVCENNFKICFIVSRYFLESLSGSNLRKYILNNSSIYKITDFYGKRPFKNIGIDPVIIFLSDKGYKNIEVDKVVSECKINDNFKNKMVTFCMKAATLSDEPWRLQPENKLKVLEKIEDRCNVSLKEIGDFYQGIITGCDKAFIVTKDAIEENNIEKDLLRRWIKNSDIHVNYIKDRGLFLIYADDIIDENKYPNAITYIGRYKERLAKRRECINSRRKWYELQWGRDESIFRKQKIIFPYKSNHNIFTKSSNEFFSADIYALLIKDTVKASYDYLSMLLNSPIYEFYFKCFGKKMGRDIYEYYPNNVERLKIPLLEHNRINNENDLYEYFELNSTEKKLILKTVKQ
ncbi:Eco57I restriction-modification methylase domain-containing protein [Clostridium oryzae]|uniref:site-specific DNA-methyltransferase (adenine-specific) n=1 Tax=Clostridium oryzae TaxID=1450648 RepID=A0A1V4IC96_9CLOT|nr:N-6 DNA methylase [Clostridium oryzae]OPJ57500.1 type IIS restriction enzyme Eco57I [Clostridium oryzae]